MLTRSQLHEIAVRRRGDADVKALLLKIKRLHEASVGRISCSSSNVI